MHYSPTEINEFVEQAERLMRYAGIPFRDTWLGLSGENMDDAIQNGGKSGGPRLLAVIAKPSGKAEAINQGTYSNDSFDCLAYDSFKILIPERLSGRKDVIMHELVHFLQFSPKVQAEPYIGYNEATDNYEAYVSQRSETEAHFIQLHYLMEKTGVMRAPEERIDFRIRLQEAICDPSKRVAMIMEAKDKGVL
jgi:hypothetical protein